MRKIFETGLIFISCKKLWGSVSPHFPVSPFLGSEIPCKKLLDKRCKKYLLKNINSFSNGHSVYLI